jgi:hypothetical protein
MKFIAFLSTFFAAFLISRGETVASGTQDSRPLSISGSNTQRIEKLAAALLISSDYEASHRIATEARWKQVLVASHIHIVFSEPRTFSFEFSKSGRARVQEVIAEEILIPISHENSPDYILVRFHDRVRAFAMYHDREALVALQKIFPPRSHQ